MKKAWIYKVFGPLSDSTPISAARRRASAILFSLVSIFIASYTFAPVAGAQLRSTHWTAESGLPQNIIRGIVQAPDGYLWIATLNGLARFDGLRFVVFDKSNTPGITANRFAAMVKGEQGDLWLYSESGAITRYHNGQFRTLAEVDGVPLGSVHGITANGNGRVWIIRDKTIMEWDKATSRFEPMKNEEKIQYKGLSWDGTGFWGAQGQTLYCFSRGNLSILKVPDSLRLMDVKKVAAGSDGAIWLSLPADRIARFFEEKWETSSKPVQTSMGVRSAWKAEIDTHLDRIVYFPSGGFEQGIRYNIIVDDDENNVWIGSEGQGLYRIQQQTIHVYSTIDGLAGANIYPVLRGRDGDMWIGTWPAGLTQVHNGAFKTYTAKDGIPGLVTALAEDTAGDIWIGTHGRVAVLSHEHIRIPEGLPRDLPVVQAIFPTRDGSLLLGTPTGIYRYKDRSGSWLEPQNGIAIGDVRVIIEGKDGDIWFGGYAGLTKMHNGVLTRWTEHEGLPSNNLRSIYEDAEGTLWVGTYDGGLGRLSGGKWAVYNKKNGLFDNGVFQILEDGQANLWMSSNRGIYRVNKQQLNDVATGSQSSVISVSYGRSDGMLNAECNGGLWPAGAKDASGKLWFPTQQGVAVVEPDAITVNQRPPRVAIESISLDHNPGAKDAPITIKRGQGSLEIQYTALSFSRPEQVVFRYLMEGLDTGWEDVGYRRTAYFSHMPAGSYVFRVMAANSDGVWSEMQSSGPITVLPPFYLSRWFIALASALALILTYTLWSLRVRQLKRDQAAQQAFSQQLIASQESERRRISGELHDSLGQRLIIIKNHALFLLQPKAVARSEEEKRQTIEEINTEASLAIDETRTISYNLRPFQLDRLGLSKAIEALVRSASRATGIHLTTSIDNIDDSFPEDLRINVYRIVQEGVNNIMKHSGASEGEIRIERSTRNIALTIRDNGAGFPSEPKSVVPGKGGFGLTGVRERATLLNGTVKIQSQSGIGTTLTIDFDQKKYREAASNSL
jgi:signal transduction histidine kinase/ligand-binding sensor domain-containing protein